MNVSLSMNIVEDALKVVKEKRRVVNKGLKFESGKFIEWMVAMGSGWVFKNPVCEVGVRGKRELLLTELFFSTFEFSSCVSHI